LPLNEALVAKESSSMDALKKLQEKNNKVDKNPTYDEEEKESFIGFILVIYLFINVLFSYLKNDEFLILANLYTFLASLSVLYISAFIFGDYTKYKSLNVTLGVICCFWFMYYWHLTDEPKVGFLPYVIFSFTMGCRWFWNVTRRKEGN
jgi:hypothetical protein